MENRNVELMPHLTKEVVEGITGFNLCAYLVALEGWRRGLELTWYKDETDLCKMHRAGGTTRGNFFSLSSGEKKHYFIRSRGDRVTNKAVNICQNKETTLRKLKEKGVPTPKGAIFLVDDEGLFDVAKDIGFPVIIKPVDGSMGRGVYTNINSTKELRDALKDFKKRYKYKKIILESHHAGQEYRIYVVGDNVIGATNRVPANITGDGVHTVQSLIDMKNKARQGNPYLNPKPIKIDYEVKLALKNNGLNLDSVLPKDRTLFLREKSNLSAGGDPIDANDELSEEVKGIAVEALKAIPDLSQAGVDIIVDPEDKTKGVVLEMNATAEISFHPFPWEGKGRDVPSAIIDHYFPETIGKRKSLAYFNYHSVIEPLTSWAADEVKVTNVPDKTMYATKFIVTGKVQKVGYLKYIRRQALKRNLQGYSRKLGEGQVEIYLMSSDEVALNDFIDICYKGSKKSKVENVNQEILGKIDQPYKLGFEIILE